MYSAHLRDMYNFDPVAVERFLKEMRLLSAQGQTAAQAMMKSKLSPLPGIAATSANARGDDGDGNDEAENPALPSEGRAAAVAAENDADQKRDGSAGGPAGVDPPRGPQRYLRYLYLSSFVREPIMV